MAVPQKQPIQINFSGSLDTKTDPNQINISDFRELNNMVFTAGAGTSAPGGGGGRLTKRNGFGALGTAIISPASPLTYSNLGSNLAAARKIFSYQNELLLNDAWNLYSYDESLNSWAYKGRSTMVELSTAWVAQDTAGSKSQMDVSIDSTSGIKIFAWFENVGGPTVKFSIQDIETGQFIVNKQLFNGAENYQQPRCLSISGQSWVFAVNTNTGELQAIPIVGQTIGSVVNVVALGFQSGNSMWPYDIGLSAGAIYLVYQPSAGGITVALLNSSLAVTASRSEAENPSNGLSFFGDGTNIWVVYNNGSDTKAFIFNDALSSTVLAPTIVDSSATASTVNNVTGCWSSTQSLAFIFYDQGSISANSVINYKTLTVSGTPSPAAGSAANLFMGSLTLTSKAFVISGIPHLVASFVDTLGVQTTYFLLNLYNFQGPQAINNSPPANIAAKIAADQGGGLTSPPGWLCGVHNASGEVWELALGQETQLGQATSSTTIYYAVGVIDCQFDFSLSNPDVQVLGTAANIASGQLTMYDAANVVEQNFHIFPAPPTVTTLTTGGVLGLQSDPSTYGYIVTYEWVDNQGQFHRSSPSAVTTPLGSVANYTFAVTALSSVLDIGATYTNNGQTFTALATYAIGTTLIAMSGTNPPDTSGALTFASGTGQSSITFSAFIQSSSAATFPEGVTTGQITLNIQTLRVTNKSGVLIKIYRTIANGSVYFLLNTAFQSIENNVEAEFVTFTDSSVPDTTVINGVQPIDENLQLYTTGELEDFAPPSPAALTTFKNRVLLVPSEGTPAFLYSKQVQIGFPVEFVPEFVQNIGTVAGPLIAIAGMDDKIILFKSGLTPGPSILYMVGTGPAASGANNDFTDPLPVAVDCGCVDRASIVLTGQGLLFKSGKGIYILDRNLQASYKGSPVEAFNQFDVLSAQLIVNTTQVRFLLSNGILVMYDYFYDKWATFSNPAGISDCIFQGLHTYVASSGQVYQETPGIYLDGATPVLMNFLLSWVKLAGLQGYQRAYFYFLLGEYLSPHNLSVSTYTNFNANQDQNDLIIPDPTNFLENWRGFFKNQRCQSFSISVQEVYTGTPGPAFTMSGINLIAGVKSPFRTISAAQSVG